MKERKRILLVEAETVLADVTAFRLELQGYDVSVVATAEEAIREVGVARPDLILTDLVLPTMDGLALVEQLMIDPQTSEIPVIVLSIDADLDRVQTLYGLGAATSWWCPTTPRYSRRRWPSIWLQPKTRRTPKPPRPMQRRTGGKRRVVVEGSASKPSRGRAGEGPRRVFLLVLLKLRVRGFGKAGGGP